MKRLILLACAVGSFIFQGMPVRGQDVPAFNLTYTNAAVVSASSNVTHYAPNLDFTNGVQITGPAEVTNATQLYVQFESDSLGNTNLSDATAATGFKLAVPGTSSIPGIVDAPVNPNPANLYYSCVGTIQSNSAWLMINYTPGTNDTTVTNQLRLIAVNGNNNLSTNWTRTNLALTVRAPQVPPPHLEVRFYNSSTNADGDVYILPTCKGLEGNGFWWQQAGVTNTWTNWMMQTTNMTVTLADIGVDGTNLQGQAYYSIYTTNFPNAAWFVSYGGGHLLAPTNASGKWDGTTTYGAGPHIAQPTASNTNGLWFGSEWNAFELTLDGNPADVGDTTYINQFSIPMVMRSFTNSYEAAQTGAYTNLDSTAYYKNGGWTNFSLALLSNVVAEMTTVFSNGIIRNGNGIPVMFVGPSSAGNGALQTPWTSPPFTNNAQNVWPDFDDYFAAVKAAQPGRQANIQDNVGLANNSTSATYSFSYDFNLTVTASNSLRMEGGLIVSNAPGSSGTYSNTTTNLVLEIGPDAGPNDNWASWSVYTAPTPANLTTVQNLRDLTTGLITGTTTNLGAYSSLASNGLGGTEVTVTGSNFIGTLQVAFCGEGNTLLPAPAFTVESDTNLTVFVPVSALSGPLTLTSTNGSGKSALNFTTLGTVVQAGPTVTPGAGSPVVSGFAPTTGEPATPIISISGDWAGVAEGSETGPGASASLVELYNSRFGSAIMGRIAGDMAAGFAFGFINSDVTNAAYQVNGTNQLYGDSPSGSWWGGNTFPASDTNRLAYSDVNTQYSAWGDILYKATAVTYGHPIYDRMKVFSGDFSRAVIQPPVALNHMPDNIWMAEIEFYDGMAAVSGGGAPGPYTLIYQARAGGTVAGVATQVVDTGQSGSAVSAVLADGSVVFQGWSDGDTNNPRVDTQVTADLNVHTIFLSQGGANLEWYAQYGFTPTNGQVWSDLDSEPVPGKGTTLLEEYTADTDPTDTNSLFTVTDMTSSVPVVVTFEPAVSGRVYAVKGTTNMVNPTWVAVPGTMSFIGGREGRYQVDTNTAHMQHYRLEVELP
jgi:hypothetical protein